MWGIALCSVACWTSRKCEVRRPAPILGAFRKFRSRSAGWRVAKRRQQSPAAGTALPTSGSALGIYAGEVVTREELRERLWSADTFVDFDHRLAVAVSKLRDALRDPAEDPGFVETVGRRGYRFLGQLEFTD
jgi:hypothetical protein